MVLGRQCSMSPVYIRHDSYHYSTVWKRNNLSFCVEFQEEKSEDEDIDVLELRRIALATSERHIRLMACEPQLTQPGKNIRNVSLALWFKNVKCKNMLLLLPIHADWKGQDKLLYIQTSCRRDMPRSRLQLLHQISVMKTSSKRPGRDRLFENHISDCLSACLL